MENEYNEKIWNEIKEIANDEDVTSIKLKGKELIVGLKRQTLETDFDGKITGKRYYQIPECKIVIKLNALYVSPPLILSDDSAGEMYPDGFWGNGQVHPHASTTGTVCWGNVAQEIVLALQGNDLIEVLQWVKEFLRTANVDDIAGAALSRWREVNEMGDIIDMGHDPQKDEYYDGWFHEEALRTYSGICFDRDGNEIDPDDARVCDACYETFCYDDMFEVGGEMFCRDCYEELAGCCSGCERDFLTDHLTYHDGEYYCDDCFNELFDQCSNCGEWCRKDEMWEDEEGYLLCEDCAEIQREEEEYTQLEKQTCEVCRKKTDHLTRWTVVDICDECLEQVKGFEMVVEDESI